MSKYSGLISTLIEGTVVYFLYTGKLPMWLQVVLFLELWGIYFIIPIGGSLILSLVKWLHAQTIILMNTESIESRSRLEQSIDSLRPIVSTLKNVIKLNEGKMDMVNHVLFGIVIIGLILSEWYVTSLMCIIMLGYLEYFKASIIDFDNLLQDKNRDI